MPPKKNNRGRLKDQLDDEDRRFIAPEDDGSYVLPRGKVLKKKNKQQPTNRKREKKMDEAVVGAAEDHKPNDEEEDENEEEDERKEEEQPNTRIENQPNATIGHKRKQINEADESELVAADQDAEMKEEEQKRGNEDEDEQPRKRVKCKDICSICLDESANDQLRLLPCLHSLCRKCGIELINRNEQRNTLTCPTCQQDHIFALPTTKIAASTLMDRCPTYHQAWNRNEHLRPVEPPTAAAATSSLTSAAAASSSSTVAAAAASSLPLPVDSATAAPVVAVPKVFHCTLDGCTKVATHLCLGCGYQCTEHELSGHLGLPRSSHIRVSLEEQKAKLKQEESEGERLKQLEDLSIKLDQLQSCVAGSKRMLDWQQAEKYYRDGLDAEAELLNDLTDLVDTLEGDQVAKANYLSSLSYNVQLSCHRLSEAIAAKRTEVIASKKLSPDARSKLSDEEFKKSLDLSRIKNAKREVNQLMSFKPILPVTHPIIALVRQLKHSSLLPSQPKLRRELQAMLNKAGKSLVNPVLLYRANWHGWTKDDLIGCCQGKSQTLLVVKVAGSGYLFGAYIAPVWPAPNEERAVSDPSLKSFIFSLINPCRHPIRLTLTSPLSAIALNSSIGFGQGVQNVRYMNLMLFYNGRPGNDSCGICFNPSDNATYSYQLDEESKKILPPGFQLDRQILGGRYCGASEIEVYQL